MIAVILAIAIAAVLALAATKPGMLRVQRSVNIKAPAETIFPLITDFQQWRNWSPYENKDPAMKRTYSGAERGKGAAYAWDGDKNVGSGRMEILEASAPQKIVIKLDFFTPFEGHNTAEFTMLPQGDGTHVTWSRPLHDQADPGLHESGQHDRKGFRSRSRQPEDDHREVNCHSNSSYPRSQRCRSIPICSTTAIARKR
jgi:uncharacterized protein YndB with AHSA1/START domain